MNEYILSICIPTYNRADVLKTTLSNLICEDSFLSGLVEICVSDNASTDNTRVIVTELSAKYQNIKYHRNERTTFIEENFKIVMSMANGEFIKPLNDYADYIPGKLDLMIELIRENIIEKPVIYFSNGSVKKKEEIIFCKDFDKFVEDSSYYITWISSAGYWRSDFNSIQIPLYSSNDFFWAAYWMLKYASQKRTIIDNRVYFKTIDLKSKGGYDFFYAFGVMYLPLYQEYLSNKKLRVSTYRKLKKLLFMKFLSNYYDMIVIQKNTKFSFTKNKAIAYLLHTYKYNYYFYVILLLYYARYYFYKIIQRFQPKKFMTNMI